MRLRFGMVVGLSALAVAFAVLPREASARDKPAARRGGPSVSESTGKRLNEAMEQLKANHVAEARAILAKIDLERLSPYELSRVEQVFATIDQSEEKYASAREHLKKALASGGLNDQEMSTVRFQLAQLHMVEGHWREGVEALKQWFATEPNPNSAAYYLLAVAYYQLDDLGAALEPAQKAVDLAAGNPQESWLELLVALRMKREEFRLALPLLRQLVAIAPQKKNYWVQLSSVGLSLNNYSAAVVPLQLAYTGNLLTQGEEFRRLAQLLVQTKIPHRAALILSRALEQKLLPADTSSYQLLGDCWIAAREYEKAVQPLGRAAELSETGELYVRLAQVQVQREAWGPAAEALRHGIDKGKVKNLGNAQLLMGIALYNLKKPQEARPWFERARGNEALQSQAEGWLRQIEIDLQSQSS